MKFLKGIGRKAKKAAKNMVFYCGMVENGKEWIARL